MGPAMSEGKDRYEERRRLENENVLLREQKENRRLKNDAEMEEGGLAIVRGLRDFFEGPGCITLEAGPDGLTLIRFRRG